MSNAGHERNHDRVAGLIFVASVHAVLGYALFIGLGFDLARNVSGALKVFDVVEEPPPVIAQPVPPPVNAEREVAQEEGAREKGVPSPVTVPPPKVRLAVPPKLVLPPVPNVGKGTGAGPGAGSSAGSGGSGNGTGSRSGAGGGLRVPAQYVKGVISGSDYPRAARRVRAEGIVYVRFVVSPEGRARGCTVTRSSGNGALDATTCRLIERRFRYRPARDGNGQPVADVVVGNQIWWFN